jgi:putative phage-type endonuclease
MALPASVAEDVWLKARREGVGASEIAAVLGISPWESPFSLHWRKRMGWEIGDKPEMEVGRRLEPACADWFADNHPEHTVVAAGLFSNPEIPWQLATPDRILICNECCGTGSTLDTGGVRECGRCWGLGAHLLECKVAYSWDEWGEPGTDDIPVHYRAQAMQQMDVLGLRRVRFAVFSSMQFREYSVDFDAADAYVMRIAGAKFMRGLMSGEAPDVDQHTATAKTLRALHPSVVDADVEVSVEFAEGYRRARWLKVRAEKTLARWENRVRDAIGDNRRAKCNGQLVASRSVFERNGENGVTTINRLNPGRATSYVS